eukprot:Opistho-2@65092
MSWTIWKRRSARRMGRHCAAVLRRHGLARALRICLTMSSLFLPSLGAMPLRTAFAGSPQPYPVNHYAPGQIWVARASDAETLTTRREPADAPDLQALIAEPALDALRQSRARLLVVRDARQQALA